MRFFSIGNIVALGFLVGFGSAAEVNGPLLGKPAPPLSFSQVLHAPPGSGTTWEGLRGQVVVLDFWATYWFSSVIAMNRTGLSLMYLTADY